jgi:hypothetical protein
MDTKHFKISLKGSNSIPRFSCAAHKLDLVIRHAIEDEPTLKDIIKTLNESNASVRQKIYQNRIFHDLKCRLKLSQLTRWASDYLLLASVKRAYEKGAFSASEVECPVSLETLVDAYIQILAPAYDFCLALQYDHASISEVNPGVLCLMNIWMTMEHHSENQNIKDFCHLLVYYLKLKFNYELTSPIYHVIYILIKIIIFQQKYFKR